jgi:hypothetical protein
MELWYKFNDWFEFNFGSWFVNGNKMERWKKYMIDKHKNKLEIED